MDIEKLKEEQTKLARKVSLKDNFKLKTIAGIDQSFFNKKIISAIVVLDYETLKPIEKKFSILDENFPYIPSYIFYREGPAILEAFNKLENKPDILMLDFHGILHPRKLGAASHLGLILNLATIGVAKNLLVGRVIDNRVYHKGEILGFELKTKEKAKPIYISPGNKVSLKSSLEITQHCLEEHKLPEPLYLAHKLATKLKKQLTPT